MSNKNHALENFLKAEFTFSRPTIQQSAPKVAKPELNYESLLQDIIYDTQAPQKPSSAHILKNNTKTEFQVLYRDLPRVHAVLVVNYIEKHAKHAVWKSWRITRSAVPARGDKFHLFFRFVLEARVQSSSVKDT